MSEELKQLIRMRGSMKQKVTNLEKYINSLKTLEDNKKPPLSEVEIRFKSNESLITDFENLQLKIELSCDDENLSEHYMERESFDSRLSVAMGFLSNYIKIHSEVVQMQTINSNSPGLPQTFDPLQGVIVPKIKLPIFKGEYDQWLEFKTTFMSTIHNNMSLSKTQKFQLLRASVEGYAKRLIEKVEFTDDNYESAWSRLCKRFDNKRVLINNHIKSIYNLESMNKESSGQFRKLLDDLSNHLAALEGLHLSSNILWEVLITYIISSKLDKVTYREWKDFKGQQELPTLDEFMEFLTNKADLLEVIQDKNSDIQGEHLIYHCPDFLKLDVASRIEKARNLKLCNNCLRTNHVKEKCQSGPCRKCNARHNTLLHLNKVQKEPEQVSAKVIEGATESAVTSTNLLVRPNYKTTVLLSTVVFKVKDCQGDTHMCRALLDSGAQSNLITEKFSKKLQLLFSSANLSIVGINQVSSNLTKKCNLTIFSQFNNFNTTLMCYVIPTISSEVPAQQIATFDWNIPENIQLSDPDFQEPREIDVLIGAGAFWDLLLDGKITLGKGLTVLQNTKLGWVVSGIAPIHSKKSICNFARNIPEDEQLKRFWEVEEVSSNTSIQSQDDIKCEELFENTTSRDNSGRYVVKFPLKYSCDLLGDSQHSAIKRFFNLERKFANDHQLKLHYSSFINEYIDLGHMTKIKDSNQQSNEILYFLPHHGVFKETSLTTKLRVVFDGSCPSESGWSLNDLQFVGPKVQNDLFSILLRFRTYAFVVSADIMKMYRQIQMHSDHRHLQNIIWREEPSQPFSIYELNTVTYGTTAAPYLAIKCLQSLALEHRQQYPQASNIILNDFYVDDLLTGSDDVTMLAELCNQIYSILASGQFHLRKWISNNAEVLSSINAKDDTLGILSLGEHEASKTLGIKWVSHTDILKYDISQSGHTSVSKRQVLSEISQIYDPLGLLSPCTIVAKVIIQELWSLKLSWDESIPNELYSKWNQFRTQLTQLNMLEIPRNTIGERFNLVEVHCFCDASKDAYAACIYLRSQDQFGNIHVRLLCAKTKVAPIKSISIPRLELCAALLAATLVNQVKCALSKNVRYIFWSDSQVVLYWIHTQPNLLEVFVANRVSKIQGLTNNETWKYVNTTQNPADVASRGIFPGKLLECDIWWNGPQFLYEPESTWPSSTFDVSNQNIPELKRKKQTILLETANSWDIFSKYSDLNKLKRVFTYCNRFIHNLKSDEKYLGPLTSREIEVAYLKLIKLAQSQTFQDVILILSKGNFLDKKHKLSSLSPFLDNDGILRVGGRLKFSNLHLNTRDPILLSSKHDLTKLIFRHKHAHLLHPGPQLLLASVRQQYWPIGGKNLAKAIVKNCMTCFRFKPTPATVPMGPLPNNRLTPTLPFQTVGIDYAGPLFLKDKKGRGSKLSKCWISVFICFVTKAIHLELITDLTSECFLSCLKRFISRRGLPSHIYSDNGLTFRGAYNEMKNFGQFLHKNQSQIQTYASNLNISWHFIPPYSPNFGGLWEAAVKSMKHHLKRTLRDATLIYEELNTLLCQIEGILNSRPLYAMSNDPNDLEPITPSHFLIGRPITYLPDTNLQEVPTNRLSRLQYVQKLQQTFWKRFSTEYISQLHQSYKWKVERSSSLKPGVLVLIKGENQPPCKWNLGRIHKVFPGADGLSRVVSIKTSKGIIKRATRHLYPLPLEEDVISEMCGDEQCSDNTVSA